MLSETGRLLRVAVKHARDAFVDERAIAAEWQALNFAAPPDLERAIAESDAFVEILRAAGTAVELLPRSEGATLDSIYVRDASVVSPRGVILCTMGKVRRLAEPAAQEHAFRSLGIPIAGRITAPGSLEGGDLIWLDSRTAAVGRGYRTNAEGIRQLVGLLGDGIEVVEVPLPHWRGEADVLHLMSLVSPVRPDLAVVHSPLLPVPFRQWLAARGIRFVEVPDGEFETMGTNVLALEPGRCVMLRGNPVTRARLEHAGVEVIEYDGNEISVKGAGGPTCLTRPLDRADSPHERPLRPGPAVSACPKVR
jgi:N-dimethylarginine dimethylaminohydrolase